MAQQKKHPVSQTTRQRARQLRQPLSPPEHKLWQLLRGRRLNGFKFRRQHPIGRYIVDFYCAEAGLVVELDGASHLLQVEYDQARMAWLEAQGYHVVRFGNQEVGRDVYAVARAILFKCQELCGQEVGFTDDEKSLSPNPSPFEGEGN
jgi:very-short-patch-repair endonuclease